MKGVSRKMAVKDNVYKTFFNYAKKAEQLFADDKFVSKEMLTYKWSDWTVAHFLARHSDDPPHWQINDKEILVLRDALNDTVAHFLAYWHLFWITNDSDILYLKGSWNKTIKEVLVKRIMDGKKKDGS